MTSVVIIGGGHSGVQTAASLRERGFEGRITILEEEHGAPYQRPPLSKEFMRPGVDGRVLLLREDEFFAENDIEYREGTSVNAVNRQAKVVHVGTEEISYDHLVFATGARNRKLNFPGADLQGIHGLKSREDAQALQAALPDAQDVVVIGAGFIGLEFAASALDHDCNVTVLEFAPRPMGRALSPTTSEWCTDELRRMGISLRTGEGIAEFQDNGNGQVRRAVSTTGGEYDADLVVVGIGVQPNTALGEECGLEIDNGIVVDEQLLTSDPAILAVGDCSSFPSAFANGRMRLESVQNATDQGQHAARVILGSDEPYADLPWFYSHQGPLRLQMTGIVHADDSTVVIGDQDRKKFSTLCFREGQLAAVESVNMAADQMAARRLLTQGIVVTEEEARQPEFSLRNAVKRAVALQET